VTNGNAGDAEKARLEAALETAHGDYLTLFDVLAAERGFYEAQIAELRGDPYVRWARRERLTAAKRAQQERIALGLPFRPTISILMATYDPVERHLREAIESVLAQTYPAFELVIADDRSTKAYVRRTIEEYAARDGRIKPVFRTANGHISRALNSAAERARGEFLAFLDHDDLLAPNALFEIAQALNARPDADFVYSDEDMLDDATGARNSPHFKPDWSPDSLLSRMYVGHLSVCRRSLFEALGGFRPGFEGSQDWDLALRITERTERIVHVPHVLYHWRQHAQSTASEMSAKPYAAVAAERALNEALERRGEPGVVRPVLVAPGTYVVRYDLPHPRRVSVIIPTRDHGSDIDRCLRSIFTRTEYPDFEVILVDNGSTDEASLAVFRSWAAQEPRVRILRLDEPFNFSRINNKAVEIATGDLLLFLNNDTEVRTHDWMHAMAEQAERPSIGAVGALLLYPNDTIQHAGVIVGIAGVAGHGHKNFTHGTPGHYMMLHAVNNYSAVTAACLMVRRRTFEDVGGFDERLAVAYNDVDLCLKIRAAGYYNVCLPHAVLYHFESKSRGADVYGAAATRLQQEAAIVRERWRIGEIEDPHYNANLTLEREDYSVEA
jgi:GT2 family glycosyltransferase